MYGTYLFIAAWVVLGLGLLFVAMSGGPRGARERLQSQSRDAQRAATAVFAISFVGLGLVIPALAINSSHRDEKKVKGEDVTLSTAQREGRTLFAQNCGGCHALKASDAVGRVGPDLDALLGKPPAPNAAAAAKQDAATKAFVLDAVVNGRQRGNGTMPALVVTPEQAPKVAAYVAAVAGK